VISVTLMAACCLLQTTAIKVPTWPHVFSANFTETTWYNGKVQQREGYVAYDWTQRVQVIRRPDSHLNPICNEIKPNRTSTCYQHSVNASRYVYWPDEGECCLHCTDCGVLSPNWVTAVPYFYTGKRIIGGASCNTWYIQSGTPDRLASTADGDLCELYDGGADATDDNPFQWTVSPASYRRSTNPRELLLPGVCLAAKRC
jgi:hypothetical protein